MSTASAKPAPSLRDVIRLLTEAKIPDSGWKKWDPYWTNHRINDAITILRSLPAAERTAPTREAIERILFKMVTEHKDKIDIGKASDSIAPERPCFLVVPHRDKKLDIMAFSMPIYELWE